MISSSPAALDIVTHHVSQYIGPSVNIRQLRKTRRLRVWLRAGKTVELRERDRVIARIVQEKQEQAPVQWPDFAARAKEIIGERMLPGADIVIEEPGQY